MRAATSVQNLAEYLAHESRDLVSRAEAEHFLRGVDTVREQLDRIEARLQFLEQRARRSDTLNVGPLSCASSRGCCRSSACW